MSGIQSEINRFELFHYDRNKMLFVPHNSPGGGRPSKWPNSRSWCLWSASWMPRQIGHEKEAAPEIAVTEKAPVAPAPVVTVAP